MQAIAQFRAQLAPCKRVKRFLSSSTSNAREALEIKRELLRRVLGARDAVQSALRARICELADRTCAIAAREPNDADVAVKCQRARSACDDARAEVTRACP